MDIQRFKTELEAQKHKLEEELARIARPSKEHPGDWEPTLVDLNIQRSTPEEMADKFEEMENAVAGELELEKRLGEVSAALERITRDTYGVCTVCGEKIPEGRLAADPSVATCTQHALA